MTEIQKRMFSLADPAYKAFQCRLMPGVDEKTVLGVRMPQLRSLSKELRKNEAYADFLQQLPHTYYDEMNLHGLLLCEERDYDVLIRELERFLPYVDNWATCDLLRPNAAFRKHIDRAFTDARKWLLSDHPFTVRFGINVLLNYGLDEHFCPEMLEWVADIRSEEYYVNMSRAWYMATALTKQYDTALVYMAERRLDSWTHRRTIQKAVESRLIDRERKCFLKTLR